MPAESFSPGMDMEGSLEISFGSRKYRRSYQELNFLHGFVSKIMYK
jgi:hypothetical protein